jgi:hypothetical protein
MENFQNYIRSVTSDYNLQVLELRKVEGEQSE